MNIFPDNYFYTREGKEFKEKTAGQYNLILLH